MEEPNNSNKKLTTEEILEILDEMAKGYENLPPQAMYAPITHADYYSLLLVLSSFFRSL